MDRARDAGEAAARHSDLTADCKCQLCNATRLILRQMEMVRRLQRQLREAQTESDRWRAEYMAAKGETWHV